MLYYYIISYPILYSSLPLPNHPSLLPSPFLLLSSILPYNHLLIYLSLIFCSTLPFPIYHPPNALPPLPNIHSIRVGTYITLFILSSKNHSHLLFSSSSDFSFLLLLIYSPNPDLSVNSKYTCRHFLTVIYIPQESDPACFIGVDG